MAAEYFDYYSAVADRMLPFLADRKAAIEQKFPRSTKTVYRRHTEGTGEDTWIRIADRETLLSWARKYAVGFHAHIRSENQGVWFVIDIDSRELSTEMAQVAAIHAVEVLAEQDIEALVKFSGSDGYHLMWNVPDLESIEDAQLWEMERAVVRAVACEVERRLMSDPRASSIRAVVGEGMPFITTSSADRENPGALLFDEYILKDNANFRVPFSVHPGTGLIAVPIPRTQLVSFRPEDASPGVVAAGWPETTLPHHTILDIRQALEAWAKTGC